jgi:hypothetical protein
MAEKQFCKDCKSYDRETKKCEKKDDFVARKDSCPEYK